MPVSVQSTGQIELFNHLLLEKPFKCVQTNELCRQELVLDSNS